MSGYVDMKKQEKDEQHAGRIIRKVIKAMEISVRVLC